MSKKPYGPPFNKKPSLVVLVLVCVVPISWAGSVPVLAAQSAPAPHIENSSGILYAIDSNRQKIVFRNTHHEEGHKEGHDIKLTSVKNVFLYPDGKEAVIEDVSFSDGKLAKYTIMQKQTNETAVVEIKNRKAIFQYTHDGKSEAGDEDLTDDFVVGPTLVPYLKERWQQILKGETISLRYAAVFRKETVGFKFLKIEEKELNGKKVVLVKMKPTSFVIAAIVDPLIFTFDKDSARLLELKGRTLPKENVNGKWKDLDVEVVYQY